VFSNDTRLLQGERGHKQSLNVFNPHARGGERGLGMLCLCDLATITSARKVPVLPTILLPSRCVSASSVRLHKGSLLISLVSDEGRHTYAHIEPKQKALPIYLSL
jgi:hypothetical protein